MISQRCLIQRLAFAVATVLSTVATSAVYAQATIQSPYSANYTLSSLGNPTGIPGYLGGLMLKQGDPNTLLIGGDANYSPGAIYAIGITRDANNHITGFSGTATKFADAPYIDGDHLPKS